jgi:hypothetical protein
MRAMRLWLTPLAMRQGSCASACANAVLITDMKGATPMPPLQNKRKNAAARLRAGTPVLITESVDEFVAMRKRLYDEIQPSGLIEEGFVNDLAAVEWDIMRLLRIKAEILNGAFYEALQEILKQVWSEDFDDYSARDRAIADLAWQWLGNDSDAKEKVARLLGQHQLDDTAIEAECFRMRAEDLERLDFMVSRAELRREKLLTGIAVFRQELGELVRPVSEPLLEQAEPGQLVARVRRGG